MSQAYLAAKSLSFELRYIRRNLGLHTQNRSM